MRDQPKVCEPRSWDYYFRLAAIHSSEFYLSKVVFRYTVQSPRFIPSPYLYSVCSF